MSINLATGRHLGQERRSVLSDSRPMTLLVLAVVAVIVIVVVVVVVVVVI